MVRRISLVVSAASIMLLAIAGAAVAAPPGMTLSSFEATATDGVVDGGVRTISVTNISGEVMADHTVSLGAAPCDCVVSGVTGGVGTIEDGLWIVGDLAPGASAEITMTYGQPVQAASPLTFPEPGMLAVLLVAVAAVAGAGALVRRYSTLELVLPI